MGLSTIRHCRTLNLSESGQTLQPLWPIKYVRRDAVTVWGIALTGVAASSSCLLEDNHNGKNAQATWGALENEMPHEETERPRSHKAPGTWVKKKKGIL